MPIGAGIMTAAATTAKGTIAAAGNIAVEDIQSRAATVPISISGMDNAIPTARCRLSFSRAGGITDISLVSRHLDADIMSRIGCARPNSGRASEADAVEHVPAAAIVPVSAEEERDVRGRNHTPSHARLLRMRLKPNSQLFVSAAPFSASHAALFA